MLTDNSSKENWNDFEIPSRLYERFSDGNKLMKLCGFYEFLVMDCYTTYFRPNNAVTRADRTSIKEFYSNLTQHARNNYTGLLKGKNVIVIQLEGMDTWMINQRDTPNIYQLQSTGLQFANHFTFPYGGGPTFHSEFCVHTGFMSPLTYTRNADSFSTNSFPFALSRQFRKSGYTISAFHMNNKEYYSRAVNYRNWGYHHFYSLRDSKRISPGDLSYLLDGTLVSSAGFYNELFLSRRPFFHYIITYTIHFPFRIDCCHGKQIIKQRHLSNSCQTKECAARLFANETDRMVGLILSGLTENGLLNTTAIVAFTDHYPHLLADRALFKRYKGTDETLWNRTPFFIWSAGLQSNVITFPTSHIDICPTLLNLFDMSYMDEFYMGSDIFSEIHPHLVFFRDGTVYNGTIHTVLPSASRETFVKKNDLTLTLDYFRRILKTAL